MCWRLCPFVRCDLYCIVVLNCVKAKENSVGKITFWCRCRVDFFLDGDGDLDTVFVVGKQFVQSSFVFKRTYEVIVQ